MTLLKFNPTRELLRDSILPSHVAGLFDSLFNESLGKFERNVFFTPRTDVVEKKDHFEISLALPGLKKEEVNIDIENGTVSISGEKKINQESKEDKFHVVENFYGKFSRSFSLPENVDEKNIKAELKDGILKLELPKSELKESKTTVEIK